MLKVYVTRTPVSYTFSADHRTPSWLSSPTGPGVNINASFTRTGSSSRTRTSLSYSRAYCTAEMPLLDARLRFICTVSESSSAFTLSTTKRVVYWLFISISTLESSSTAPKAVTDITTKSITNIKEKSFFITFPLLKNLQ